MHTDAPLGAKGYDSLPLKTAAELLQVFSLCTGRGQCCIKAAPCNHIPFSFPLTLFPADWQCGRHLFSLSAFQHTKGLQNNWISLRWVVSLQNIVRWKKQRGLWPTGMAKAVKVCWVIKGYALNTVPFLLVTCRQLPTVCVCGGLTCIYRCPPGLCGSLKRSLGSLVSCLTDPWATRTPHVTFSVPFSIRSFRGAF